MGIGQATNARCARNGGAIMNRGTKKHCTVGARVQIRAYSDLWMQGALVGTVERFIQGSGDYLAAGDPRGASMFVVRLDHPQVKRLHRFIADDCTYIKAVQS